MTSELCRVIIGLGMSITACVAAILTHEVIAHRRHERLMREIETTKRDNKA